MKILLARTAGFCMGVRRAMEIAVDAAGERDTAVHTLGPIIHNPQAVALLESRGVQAGAEVPESGTVIIRAHGLAPAERTKLAESGARIVDATCPHVVASQNLIARASEAGRHIVIIGDPEHPEVEGLAGCATTPVHHVRTVADAAAVPAGAPATVIAQTTFRQSLFAEIGHALARRLADAEIHDTICRATEKRQEEALAIAKLVDVMVVVGGRESANTRRLADIGRDCGKKAIHVETAEELRAEDFAGVSAVGVTAGASTPGWMTQSVIERLESFDTSFTGKFKRAVGFLARARVLTSIGAAALCHAVATLLQVRPRAWEAPVSIAAYVFVAYTINRRGAPEKQAALVQDDRFFAQYRHVLVPAALVAAVASAVLVWRIDWRMLMLMLIAHAAAVLYAVPLLPKRFRFRRMRDVPASKDVLVALAWTCVVIGACVFSSVTTIASSSAFYVGAVVFLVLLAKTNMLDLRDIEGDRLIGIETLPVLLGRRRAILLLYVVECLVAALLLGLGFVGLGTDRAFAFALLIVPVYGGIAIYMLVRAHFRGDVHCQLVADGQLLATGLASLAWSWP